MKKLAILFGLMVLSSQFPLSPSRALPVNLASSLEYGRQWSSMFFRAFGPVDASPAVAEPSTAAPRKACDFVEMADMNVPAPPEVAELPEPAEFPAQPTPAALAIDVTVPAVVADLKPLIVRVNAPFDEKQISADVAKEMAKAMCELRTQLKQLDAAHRKVDLQRHLEIRTREAAQRLQKVRIILNTKSA